MRRPLARVLVIAALACIGLLGAARAASAQSEIQGQNRATGAAGATGATAGANVSSFRSAPTAVAAGSANAQQNGSNRSAVSQSSKSASGDPVVGSQVTGATGDTTVQSSNSAVGVFGRSGAAITNNTLVASAGPTAFAVGRAQSSQLGSNSLSGAQDVSSETGDAVVGSQVTGIAGAEAATVSNMSSTRLVNARSGQARSVNNAPALRAGPSARGRLSAQAQQVGNDDEILEQSNASGSGDALAGSQVTGIVGGSNFDVQQSNASRTVRGVAGRTLADNTAASIAGPVALSTIHAQASQNGDTSLADTQTVDALSGEAVVGSQVTGLVGLAQAHMRIQNQQASDGPHIAVSSTAFATNTLTQQAGPLAAGATAALTISADAQQVGDDAVTTEQTSSAASSTATSSSQITGAVAGDQSTIEIGLSNKAGQALAEGQSGGAVSGSQVTSAVAGSDSDVDVQAQNVAARPGGTSFAFAAVSGATNVLTTQAGPNAVAFIKASAGQVGDTVVDATQTTNDVNVATIVGGPSATAGNAAAPGPIAFATTSQVGSDEITLAQDAASGSGDAVSGSQVTGAVVGDGSETTVQQANFARGPISISGAIPVTNTAVVAAGGGPVAGPTTTGLEFLSGAQWGDAIVTVDQTIDAPTGDALSGAQLAGVVGGETTTIGMMQDVRRALSFSGDASGVNAVMAFGDSMTVAQSVVAATGDALSGAQVTGIVGAVEAVVQVSQNVRAVFARSGIAAPTNAADLTATASIFQSFAGVIVQASDFGDNVVDLTQDFTGDSGDAISAGQVNGRV